MGERMIDANALVLIGEDKPDSQMILWALVASYGRGASA